MIASFDDHKFNDDLLLQEADRNFAKKRYPSIFHVLDHPELRELFSEYDRPALRAKSTGLKAGLLAIGFGFSAFAVAASELLLTASQLENWTSVVLAVISGLCGVLSVLIGSIGVLSAGRKREWLYCRLMTEKIRQFHFQTLAFRLPSILASLKGEAARSRFLSDRALWFESFKTQTVGRLDSIFASVIREDEKIDACLHGGGEAREGDTQYESNDLDPIFHAYRELRILHQLSYADYKLQDDHHIFSSMPRRQSAVLSQAVFTWIILLLIMHVGIMAGALFPNSIFAAFHSPNAIVVVICLALAALATRAIEQGFQPEREIERYQQYRSAIRAILERYDGAQSHLSKLAIMREMERLAFDEMRNFLITNERARFVM
jgi:hypothetical protein